MRNVVYPQKIYWIQHAVLSPPGLGFYPKKEHLFLLKLILPEQQ